MPKTKHFNSRIQQRGILESTIEAAQKYGLPDGDKIILGKKQIDFAIKNLDKERKNLIKARVCLAMVVVIFGTTFVIIDV